MGFYNMAEGEAPYIRRLAQDYAMSDNHHQSVMGGATANFQALVTGHAIAYRRDGAYSMPPANQIANPDPRPGTNNWHIRPGFSGASYTNCADARQPGVRAIRDYLAQLPYRAFNDGNCSTAAYYLVGDIGPGYRPNGTSIALSPQVFAAPPQAEPTIAEALAAKAVPWKW
jgi:phospholipase C